MNKYEVIHSLADANGQRLRPFRDIEEAQDHELVENKIPFFQVSRNQLGGGYQLQGFNYEWHDNAGRMPFYCDWLRNHVLPHLPTSVDASGIYPIELHDTYTYLDDNRRDFYTKYGGLTFSKKASDRRPVLVPDPYMIANYGGRLEIKDDKELHKKKSIISFAGGTTGDMDPVKNMRLRVAHWASSKSDISSISRIGITNIVQMPEAAVVRAYGIDALKKIIINPMTQQEQYDHKYLLSIDGNTSCWDRLIWIANSHSLLMKYTSDQINWNYPLCLEGQHFVDVDMDNMKNKFEFMEANPHIAHWMTINANAFAVNYANSLAALHYTVRLMENMAMNKD